MLGGALLFQLQASAAGDALCLRMIVVLRALDPSAMRPHTAGGAHTRAYTNVLFQPAAESSRWCHILFAFESCPVHHRECTRRPA